MSLAKDPRRQRNACLGPSSPSLKRLSRFVTERVAYVLEATVPSQFFPSERLVPQPPPSASPAEATSEPRLKRRVAECKVTTTELVLPSDANKDGFLFAGPLLKWIDICACMASERFSGVNCVTVSMDDVHFMSRVRVGETVTLVAQVLQAWKTSMEVGIVATIERLGSQSAERELCCNATATFVTKDRQTLPLPVFQSEEEQDLAERANARREMRFKVKDTVEAEPSIKINTTTSTELVMPHHCQHMGTTFGGWILHWMESTGSIAACRYTHKQMICASTDTMQFLAPSYAGNVLEFNALVTACWKTSLEVGCWAYVEDLRSGQRKLACQMYSTYVLMDAKQDGTGALPSMPQSEKALDRRRARLQRKTLLTPITLSLPASDFDERAARHSIRDVLELTSNLKTSGKYAQGWEILFDGYEAGIPLVVEGLEGFTITCVRFQCQLGAPAVEVNRLVNDFNERKKWDSTVDRVEILNAMPNGKAIAKFPPDSGHGEALEVDMLQIFYKLGYDLTVARVRTTETSSKAYVSASRSIQHPDAPPSVEGRRVEVLPSGWVVRETDGGCTVVFIMQLGALALAGLMQDIDINSFVTDGRSSNGDSNDVLGPEGSGPMHLKLSKTPLGLNIQNFFQLIKKFPVEKSIFL